MGGRVENDITFDHTLYTGADPKSFGGVDVLLNKGCELELAETRLFLPNSKNKIF